MVSHPGLRGEKAGDSAEKAVTQSPGMSEDSSLRELSSYAAHLGFASTTPDPSQSYSNSAANFYRTPLRMT